MNSVQYRYRARVRDRDMARCREQLVTGRWTRVEIKTWTVEVIETET